MFEADSLSFKFLLLLITMKFSLKIADFFEIFSTKLKENWKKIIKKWNSQNPLELQRVLKQLKNQNASVKQVMTYWEADTL